VEGDFCTGCGYCKECPEGFDPGKFMQAMRDFAMYGVKQERLGHWLLSKYPHTSLPDLLRRCVECGKCEQKCPQELDIVAQIQRGKALLKLSRKSLRMITEKLLLSLT